MPPPGSFFLIFPQHSPSQKFKKKKASPCHPEESLASAGVVEQAVNMN